MDRYIVVNATALDRGGALSILKQFIDNIPENENKWLIFCPDNVQISTLKSNVRIEPILEVKPMIKRFWWDAFGLDRWLKTHKVDSIACVSLQNTGFHISKKDIPHFIYYHQSLPFYPYKWNPFKKEYRTLWFYKNIYPFFIKLFLNKETRVFVQLYYIKQGFVKRFKHPEEKVSVFSPCIASLPNSTDSKITLSNSINLFYPAANFFYKNHRVLYEAIKGLETNVHLYVTIPSKESNVSSTGKIPFDEVCWMYRNCDALVFPSYIETFGLPLLEAALTGMPIIAADLPYAREVLAGYEGVVFVPHNSPKAWKDAIEKIKKGERFTPINISHRPNWIKLFESINKSLYTNVDFQR